MEQDILSVMFSDFFKQEITDDSTLNEFTKSDCEKSFHAGIELRLKISGEVIKAISYDLAKGEDKVKLEKMQAEELEKKILSGWDKLFPNETPPKGLIDSLKKLDSGMPRLLREIEGEAAKSMFKDMLKASSEYGKKNFKVEKNSNKNAPNMDDVKSRVDEFLKKEFGKGFAVEVNSVH